jgi:hypothetical protein
VCSVEKVLVFSVGEVVMCLVGEVLLCSGGLAGENVGAGAFIPR